MTTNDKPQIPIRLPFDKSPRGDWSIWIYKHRMGLLVTVVLYLIAAIWFVTYKISLNSDSSDMILIELAKDETEPTPPTPEQIKEQEIEKMQMAEMGRVSNRVSNDNSKFDATLRDNKGTKASEIYEEAERVQRELEASRAAYANSLRQIEERARKKSPTTSTASKSDQTQDPGQIKGAVLVAYNIENRTHTYLHKPAYQCQKGGVVVVLVTVNRSGKVIATAIDKASSDADDCMLNMARQSASVSTFNIADAAPEKQKGTITYTFVPQ